MKRLHALALALCLVVCLATTSLGGFTIGINMSLVGLSLIGICVPAISHQHYLLGLTLQPQIHPERICYKQPESGSEIKITGLNGSLLQTTFSVAKRHRHRQ